MTWRASLLESARDREVAHRIIVALDFLLERDQYLFEHNVGERSISHRLAIYVEEQFDGWNVDCEYDRDGEARKMIPRGSGNDDDQGSMVLPDIVVHRRGPRRNFIVFELKKSNNREPDEKDHHKLRAYGTKLGYEHGVFIRFLVGDGNSGIVTAKFIYPE